MRIELTGTNMNGAGRWPVIVETANIASMTRADGSPESANTCIVFTGGWGVNVRETPAEIDAIEAAAKGSGR